MKARRRCCTIIAGCLVALGVAQAQPVLRPFSFREGFEQKDRMQVWYSEGQADVAFKGLTDEAAFEGNHSFKLDMTIRDGRCHYWHVPLPVPWVPCAGRLHFSARLRVGEGNTASVSAGVGYVFPPTQHSVGTTYETFSTPTGAEWKLIERDLVADGRSTARWFMANFAPTVDADQVGVGVNRLGVQVFGEPGQRAVVYLDDVKVEGETPDLETYADMVQRRMEATRAALAQRITGWQAALDRGCADLAALPALPPEDQRVVETARSAADRLAVRLAEVAGRPFATPAELAEIEEILERVQHTPLWLRQVAQGRLEGRPFLLYTPRAITNQLLTTDQAPIPLAPGSELALLACPGEYEPTTLALYALRELNGLHVTVSDLSGPGTIPAAAVEPYVVKCWYQAGRGIGDVGGRLLVPELLLKDDRLVRVDVEKQENWLRSSGDGSDWYAPCSGPTSDELQKVWPVDAKLLHPVDVPARSLKQFWLTVHVPAEARPGVYRGTVGLRAQGEDEVQVPLTLTVHPFTLSPSPLEYAVYYTGGLRIYSQPGAIDGDHKSEQQFEAEMRDCLAHGVPHPTQPLVPWQWFQQNERVLPRALELRRPAGLPGGSLFLLNAALGNSTDTGQLRELQQRIRSLTDWSALSGYTDLHFYGIDEATMEVLKSQRAAWQAAHEAGARIYVSCYGGTFEAVGDLLDVAVLSGKPDPEEARKYHAIGHRVFCYGFPQVAAEEPATYRRNYGLELWKAGFDGAMPYAYQQGFGHVWNDFDDNTYRDHVFAYPTGDGVVDTVQWEGFREAVDDVRYVATLERAISQASAARQQTAADARKWLDALDPAGDLYEIRERTVEWIVKLQ